MQPTRPNIREARIEDAHALAALKILTFRETFLEGFGIRYPPDDLQRFEEESYGMQRIEAELVDPLHRTWVAEDGRQLLAYAHVGPCKLPHADVQPGDRELYQLYVARTAQGAGLGTSLLDWVLDPVRNPDVPAWLGVWSGNDRAQALYRKRGFDKVGGYHFRVGDWRDDEYIFRRL